MARWKFTAPDGTEHIVEGDTQEGAFEALQAQITQQTRDEFSNMPWYQKAGTAADDLVRTGANALTFGLADRLAGIMPGSEGFAAEKEKSREASDRAGLAALPGEVAGYWYGGKWIPTGVNAAAKWMGGPGAVQAVTKGVVAGAETAALGAGEAMIRDDDIGTGATTGAIAGPLGQMAAGLVKQGVRGYEGLKGLLGGGASTAEDAASKAATRAPVETPPAETASQAPVGPALPPPGPLSATPAPKPRTRNTKPKATSVVETPPAAPDAPPAGPLAPKTRNTAPPSAAKLKKALQDANAAMDAATAARQAADEAAAAASGRPAGSKYVQRANSLEADAKKAKQYSDRMIRDAQKLADEAAATNAPENAVPPPAPKKRNVKAAPAPEPKAAPAPPPEPPAAKPPPRAKRPPPPPVDLRGDAIRAIDEGIEAAGIHAKSATGKGYDQAISAEMERLLRNKTVVDALSPDDIAAMRRVITGDPAQIVSRKVGKLASPQSWLGSGGAGLAITGMGFNPLLAAGAASLPFVGVGARMTANAGAKNATRDLQRTLKGESPPSPAISQQTMEDMYKTLRMLGIDMQRPRT